jgi:hypothetical protein
MERSPGVKFDAHKEFETRRIPGTRNPTWVNEGRLRNFLLTPTFLRSTLPRSTGLTLHLPGFANAPPGMPTPQSSSREPSERAWRVANRTAAPRPSPRVGCRRRQKTRSCSCSRSPSRSARPRPRCRCTQSPSPLLPFLLPPPPVRGALLRHRQGRRHLHGPPPHDPLPRLLRGGVHMRACGCMRVNARACVNARARAPLCVCVCACVCVL